MVSLAVQLIDRQTSAYDPADLEDRYETRLRAMLDAKIKGEGVLEPAAPALAESNVVDLMAALRKSLGEALQPAAAATRGSKPPKQTAKATAAEETKRKQPALKLPIEGGKSRPAERTGAGVVAPEGSRSRRKAS